MTDVRSMRLVCSEFWADVRLTHLRGRWKACANTPGGPTVGVAWFPIDALQQALQPFGAAVDELITTVPEDLCWR